MILCSVLVLHLSAFHVQAPLTVPLLALVSPSPVLLYLLHCINLGSSQETLIPHSRALGAESAFGSEDPTGTG